MNLLSDFKNKTDKKISKTIKGESESEEETPLKLPPPSNSIDFGNKIPPILQNNFNNEKIPKHTPKPLKLQEPKKTQEHSEEHSEEEPEEPEDTGCLGNVC